MQVGGYILRRRRRSPNVRSRKRRSVRRNRYQIRNKSRRRTRSPLSSSFRRTMRRSPSRSVSNRRRRTPVRRRRTSIRRRPIRRRVRRGRGTKKVIKLNTRVRLGGDTRRKNLQKMKFQDLRRGVRMFSLL